MYFPIRWPQILNIDRGASSSLVCVASDYNRSLFAVLGEDNISIWLEKLCVQIACHVQTPESLGKHGHNVKVVWKRDSSMLAILTTKGHLLLYDVIVDESSRPLFEQLDSSQATLKRESAELFVKDRVLPLKLAPSSHLSTSVDVASVLNFGDELLVACTSGCLLRVGWDASQRQELTLDLRDIPFASGGSSSSLSTSLEFLNDGPLSVPLSTRRSGQGTVCYLDEASGQFAHSHRLALSAKDFPEAGTVAGPVGALRWTPDGAALFLAWSRGGFSLWSVFGSLLACSLNWEGAPQGGLSRVVSARGSSDPPLMRATRRPQEWGAEGYHLWMVASPSGEPQQREVMLMNFVKSASTVNPGPSGGGRHVLLQGADRVLVSSESDLAERDALRSQDGSRGNKHWTVELEQDFMVTGGLLWWQSLVVVGCINLRDGSDEVRLYPRSTKLDNMFVRVLRLEAQVLQLSLSEDRLLYSAIDTECHHVAVAGRGGFAHCSLTHNKWKFFGNETQVRLYPRSTKLDNMFVRVLRLEAQVLQLSLSEDRLLVFTADGRLALYRIHLGGLERLQELDLGGLVPHPLCVVSATLAHLGAAAKLGVLLNVCGRLVLLQQDPASSGATPGGATPVGGTPRGGGRLAARHWSAPTVLAFCVERVWVADGRPDPRMPHLTQALWIACGVQGMQVWLPLFPPGGNPGGVRHAFMAKRIMLPIAVHIYPLAVLFEEAVVLGAESDTALCGSDTYPLCVVSKSSQVYLHPILRQLLCRNLGYHAWEIARSCAELPYFHHSLELLLHEVLEEEAMSSEPIPDALLPRVIDFIREFPVFLQTVVQCARKTELALWPHLFAAVGNPKDLFQECLLQGQLDTAASYLLVRSSMLGRVLKL
ncbi:hypothetical protein IscW_ISCW015636 [Ixodes scapularis]|uniref:Protein RIC1 homolog n=1 Tax=Ixodes scapularis TaxID=6945 RepID=B7P4G0_IXOSC|nr:hypothetical protein IscW_ISCW015636 [Ixodes scapularis]|eukprot:XP_002406014.1 hypothetical protein IscW_ISCW015636 [Ixodes scapularis]